MWSEQVDDSITVEVARAKIYRVGKVTIDKRNRPTAAKFSRPRSQPDPDSVETLSSRGIDEIVDSIGVVISEHRCMSGIVPWLIVFDEVPDEVKRGIRRARKAAQAIVDQHLRLHMLIRILRSSSVGENQVQIPIAINVHGSILAGPTACVRIRIASYLWRKVGTCSVSDVENVVGRGAAAGSPNIELTVSSKISHLNCRWARDLLR